MISETQLNFQMTPVVNTYTLYIVNYVDTLRVDTDKDRNVLVSDERSQTTHRLLHLALEKSTPVKKHSQYYKS